MAEYIDKQAALDMVRGLEERYVNNLPPMIDKADACNALDTLPFADVQPVHHGKWICSDDEFPCAVCSVCKWDSGEAWEYAKKNFKYCPNCGARMDGEQNE